MGDIGPPESPSSTEDDNVHKPERRKSRSMLDLFQSSHDVMDAIGTSETETEKIEQFRYKMNHQSRGKFYIFNHKKFSMPNAPTRKGTDIDKENLEKTAKLLGFEVIVYDNLELKSLQNIIDQCANSDYTDCDCFACAVFTHGESNDYLYAEDEKYPIKDLLDPFRKCQSLNGKPKLFFIQACRGTKLDHGTLACDSTDALGYADEDVEKGFTIPVEADFFIAYSTVAGYYAWRHEENGSWFIQALCFCLKKYRTDFELLQTMTRVNRMVAYDFESCTHNQQHNNKKQMPSFVTRLTKDLYFCNPDCREKVGREYPDGIREKLIGKPKRKTKKNDCLETQLMKKKLELVQISKKEAELKVEMNCLKEKIIKNKLECLEDENN